MELLFFGILIFIFLDLALLKRRSVKIFGQVFSFSPRRTAMYGLLFVCVLVLGLAPTSDKETLFALFIFYILGLYMNGRIQFKRILKTAGPEAASPGVIVASESMETFLIWSLGLVVGSVAIKVAAKFYDPIAAEMAQMAIFSMYSSVVMFALIVRLSRRQTSLDFKALTGLRTNAQPFWKLWVLPAFLGIFWAGLCAVIMAVRPINPPTPFGQMLENIHSMSGILAFLGAAVVLAPFFEEVIFRGFLFSVIRFLRGTGLAVVVVAGLFGLMHVEQYWGDGAAIAMVGALGLLLTLFRAWTGSSIPGIVAHYTFNGAMTVIPFIMVLLSNPIYFQYQIEYARLDNRGREALLIESIKRYPDHASSYNDLAWLYAEENANLEQALDLAEKALSLDPDNYMILDTKAEVLYKLGRVGEAVAIEADLVRRYPDIPLLQEQLEKFQHAMNP